MALPCSRWAKPRSRSPISSYALASAKCSRHCSRGVKDWHAAGLPPTHRWCRRQAEPLRAAPDGTVTRADRVTARRRGDNAPCFVHRAHFRQDGPEEARRRREIRPQGHTRRARWQCLGMLAEILQGVGHASHRIDMLRVGREDRAENARWPRGAAACDRAIADAVMGVRVAGVGGQHRAECRHSLVVAFEPRQRDSERSAGLDIVRVDVERLAEAAVASSGATPRDRSLPRPRLASAKSGSAARAARYFAIAASLRPSRASSVAKPKFASGCAGSAARIVS